MNHFVKFMSICIVLYILAITNCQCASLEEPTDNNDYVVENGSLRISNGHVAERHQFSWNVVHGLYFDHLYGLICNAVLIDSLWVLIAAKCVSNTNTKVIAGYVNISDPLAVQGSVIASVEKIIKYEEPYNGTHNLALLKLKTPIYESEFVKYAKLPKSNLKLNGEHVFVVGHGILNNEDYRRPDLLHYAELQIDKKCTGQFLCGRSVYNSSNICIGDTGGLVLKNSNVIVGLTHSLTNQCGVEQRSYYVDLRSYLDWIKENTGLTSE